MQPLENSTAEQQTKTEFEYVDLKSVDLELFCSLCGRPFVDAVISNCGHSFCYRCVAKETQPELVCPLDEQKIGLNFENPTPNIVANNMVNKLVVSCIHIAGGCPWKGERKLLSSHSNECPFRPASCLNGCGKNGEDYVTEEDGGCLKREHPNGSPYQLMHKNLESHHSICARRVLGCVCETNVPLYAMPDHLEFDCPMQPTQCQCCEETVTRSDLNKHWNSDCQGIVIECNYKSFGCEYESPRGPMSYHINHDCIFYKLRGFLRSTTDEVKELQEKMEKMEERTAALENENSMLKQQLFLLQEKQRIAKTRANEEIEARTRERKDAVVTLRVLTQLTQTVQQLQLQVQQTHPQQTSTKSIRHASLQSYFEPTRCFALQDNRPKTAGNTTHEDLSGSEFDDFGQFASFPFCSPPQLHQPLPLSSSLRSSSSLLLTGTSASSRSPLLGSSSPATQSPAQSNAVVLVSRPPSPSSTSSSWTAFDDKV